ncbi:MAG TPA: homocysteine S-methyltransferase family protein [Desulfitobacterium sp.]|nr:homocysteine S-methyltransferase family protein [Desulfitobacterium sp.]HVJ47603.1 homocysteine S-methyltransferase family protein [Desulfitobacterium sp.]
MNHDNLRKHLQQQIVIGDGAMATLLYQFGVPVGSCYEELNLTNPALIRSVHESYIRAGAQLIETNTFRVNRAVLTAMDWNKRSEKLTGQPLRLLKRPLKLQEKARLL